MKFNHVFLHIENQNYFDYVGLMKADEYSWIFRHMKSEDTPVFSYNLVCELRDRIDQYLDQSFVLNHGDEIHVVPDCPIPTQDIRNNYKLKRGFDSGVCNVYSPFKVDSNGFCVWTVVVVPSKKQMYMTYNAFQNDMDALREAQDFIPDANIDNSIVYRSKNAISMEYNQKLEYYIPLLMHTNAKPCVSYKKLEFNHGNELTVDVLQFVLQSGTKTNYDFDDAEEKFLINLAMLNQHNWREYPRTISLMFNMIDSAYGVGHYVYRRPNRYSKFAREVINIAKSCPAYAGEKDFEMAKALYCAILNIDKDVLYVNNEQLQTKMMEHNINYANFCEVFNNITRITPKKYEAVESGDSVSAGV